MKSWDLFPQKLSGGDAGEILEQAGEVMGEVEAEEARGLADVVAVHQQTLGLVDDEIVDVADGGAARGLMDEVAEVSGRVSQFRGAPSDSGQAVR